MSASPPLPAPSAPAPAPASSERLKRLSEELRCLVCQNQTLADSNADLAVDLKRQIETLLAQGQSDSQILDYMVARYGDFVLYKPPFAGRTAFIWLIPIGLLVLGVAVLAALQLRVRRQPEVALNEQDSERLSRLLADDD